jgi:4-deoxy-L-threo-5-hexosulose-uronate ketol-isomerase
MTMKSTLKERKTMDVRYLPNLESYRRMTTAELRQAFVLDQLFVRNKVTMVYCDSDRAIVGGAVPMDSGLRLEASQKEMSAKYFTERREVGIVDVGGSGKIRADKIEYSLERKDMLYIGRGIEQIEFFSVDSNDPAVFYFI